MGKIEGKYENNEHTKKGDKNDDGFEKGICFILTGVLFKTEIL